MAKSKTAASTSIWENRIVDHGVAPASTFTAHELNPHKHPAKQRRSIRGSLNAVGWVKPVVVSKRSGKMLDGHARIEEALDLGPNTPIPFVTVDVSEDEERLILIELDATTGQAQYDVEMLQKLMATTPAPNPELRSLYEDLALMNNFDLNKATADPGEGGDDFEEKPPSRPETRPGDLYIIKSGDGRIHKLLCGDSTSAKDVTRLMDGERAGLFATDPPYVVKYDGMNHPSKWNLPEEKKVKRNKDWSENYREWDDQDFEKLYDGFIGLAVEHAITDNAPWYCWHASANQTRVEASWKKYGAFVHQQIIWVKNMPVLTYGIYMWKHEPCFFGWKKGGKIERITNSHMSTVWEIPNAHGAGTVHPTMKPIEVFARPMRFHLRAGELAYEPFAGSGTQLIAAHREGRRCYAIEMEPAFCDVVIRRCEAENMRIERKRGHPMNARTPHERGRMAPAAKSRKSRK
jgi:DNA modification methylase